MVGSGVGSGVGEGGEGVERGRGGWGGVGTYLHTTYRLLSI